jgi:hypothetical protein
MEILKQKHGNTLISTLREAYGKGFAHKVLDDEKLSGVLLKLDEQSLSQLIRDQQEGNLEKFLEQKQGSK